MCDLKSKSKLETVTVYKLCRKHKNKYYAYFSGMEISVGNVADMSFKSKVGDKRFRKYSNDKSRYGYKLYNELAVGRTTGFLSKRMATNLQFGDGGPSCGAVLLEIVIAGDIVRGTGSHIIGYWEELNKAIVYAGRQIVSYKEVDFTPDEAVVKMIFEEREKRRQERNDAFIKRQAELHRKRKERREKREAEVMPV